MAVAILATHGVSAAAPATQESRNAVFDGSPNVVPAAKGVIVTRDGQRLLCWADVRDGERVTLKLFESRDFGQTFTPLAGVVDSDIRGTDLGDASILETRDGTLWISYRKNHMRGPDAEHPRYSMLAARSRDGGKTWEPPTVVATSVGQRGRPSRGLWASYLFERSDGAIQCYYDDEDSPFPAGKGGHQWATVKTWDAATGAWTKPVTASRAHDANDLSRDGMMSVVEVAPMRLLMVFESVQTKPPFANVVRSVTSEDGGATWSWQTRERDVVYSPPRTDGAFMALAPWMTRCNDGRLVVVFCTDEDRKRPFVSGTPAGRMQLDVKAIVSTDHGKSWGTPRTIVGDAHHYYLPGIASRDIDGKIELVAMFQDMTAGNFQALRGFLP